MTLYEIDEAIEACIDPETGEVDGEALERLQMERDQKIEDVACWIKNLESEVLAIVREETALKERRQEKQAKVEKLERWLKTALQGQRFETGKCAVKFRRAKYVKVVKADMIPSEYMRYKPTPEPEPDKIKIKQALAEGAEIPGVELAEKMSCTVR